MRAKKVMAIILTLAITLTLAACGGNSGGGDGVSREEYERLLSELDRLRDGSGSSASTSTPASSGTLESPPTPSLPAIEENPVSDFEYKAIAGGIEIVKYIGTPVRVVIPANIEGLPVTSIGELAFFQTGIMEVIIPDSVTNIGRSAFNGNEGLTNVTMAKRDVTKGSLIHFGGYFWRVLDVQGSEALIIIDGILEERMYHGEYTEITWEHSDIRQYLNGGFYGGFSEADKARIIETSVINDNNPQNGTDGGNNTTDKIFLLSIDEVNHYFADDSARVALNASGEARWWWLRSPGRNYILAAYVRDDGNVNIDGNRVNVRGNDVSYHNGGVRPALWLNLES